MAGVRKIDMSLEGFSRLIQGMPGPRNWPPDARPGTESAILMQQIDDHIVLPTNHTDNFEQVRLFCAEKVFEWRNAPREFSHLAATDFSCTMFAW